MAQVVKQRLEPRKAPPACKSSDQPGGQLQGKEEEEAKLKVHESYSADLEIYHYGTCSLQKLMVVPS